jgi:hypothetical protein
MSAATAPVVVTDEERVVLGATNDDGSGASSSVPHTAVKEEEHRRRIVVTQQQQQQQQQPQSVAPIVQVFRGGAASARGLSHLPGTLEPPPQLELVDPSERARRAGFVYDRTAQEWVAPDVLTLRNARASAPSEQQLLSNFVAHTGGAPAELTVPHMPFFGPLWNALCLGTVFGLSTTELVINAYVPKLIPPEVLNSAWILLQRPFPVDVRSPNNTPAIGSAVVEYYRAHTILGQSAVLYGLRKATPFGVGVGGSQEYHGGIYEVPAAWTERKRYAIVSVSTMDATVGLLRDTGELSSVPLADVLGSPSSDVQDAVARVRRDYPYVSGDLFAGRYAPVPDEVYTGNRAPRRVLQWASAAPGSAQADNGDVAPAAAGIMDYTYFAM